MAIAVTRVTVCVFLAAFAVGEFLRGYFSVDKQ